MCRNKLTKHERELARRLTNVGVRTRKLLVQDIGPFYTRIWFHGYMDAVRSMLEISSDVRWNRKMDAATRTLNRLQKPGKFVTRRIKRTTYVPSLP